MASTGAVNQRRQNLIERLRTLFEPRPWWMNGLMLFCVYMTIIYMPFDLFLKPVEQDQEVWFGFTLTGWWAKATEPLHWLIYGAGAWGFYHMKSWMWPWAALYAAQVAIGMAVWVILRGNWLAGLGVSLPFVGLTVALWLARPRFDDGALTRSREEEPAESSSPE
jgi:hypothetical protein